MASKQTPLQCIWSPTWHFWSWCHLTFSVLQTGSCSLRRHKCSRPLVFCLSTGILSSLFIHQNDKSSPVHESGMSLEMHSLTLCGLLLI